MKEMKLRRLWNTYVPAVIRRNELLSLLLFCLAIVIFLLWFGPGLEEISPSLVCQSEIHIFSESLNKSGIHVVPSTPKKRGIYSELRRHDLVELEWQDDPLKNECVEVFTPGDLGRLLTCIHDPKKDLMLSAHLKNEGAWEPENVEALYEAHKRYPDLMLVDLGCNVGVFTLPAAKMGMEVVAVDAMMASLKLLQRSLLINGLSCHVTLIHNALHRTRTKMRVAVDPTNIGGSSVAEILKFRENKTSPSHLVDAICLDDLVPLVKGRNVFLKMDLEGSEAAVFECAEKFFAEVNVKILLLEWMYYRHSEKESGFIKDFLISHNMVPTWMLDRDREIDMFASHGWPDNVFWMSR